MKSLSETRADKILEKLKEDRYLKFILENNENFKNNVLSFIKHNKKLYKKQLEDKYYVSLQGLDFVFSVEPMKSHFTDDDIDLIAGILSKSNSARYQYYENKLFLQPNAGIVFNKGCRNNNLILPKKGDL